MMPIENLKRSILVVLFQLLIPIGVLWANPEGDCCKNTDNCVLPSTLIQPIASGLWFEASVWPNGQLPTMNDDVIIPAGILVWMAGNCRANTIEVAGTLGAVNWQAGGAWIDLQTRAIHVLNGGVLEIGTESTPYIADCNITLIGSKSDPDICPMMGSKFIGAMSGGRIDMHGINKKSWTQLNQTALAGATQIVLKETIDWEAGDEIVIASTAYDMNQAEKRTITQVNGNTVTLNSPLNHTHFGQLQTYTRPDDPTLSWTLDERAEVGLLSKNITIKGDNTSNIGGFGGHIMGMNGSIMKASNIELYQMGQKAVLGRYPWHWHLGGAGGTGQYLKNSSIHHTYNRAVTIHSTNNTLVEWNVAYDNLGHAFFFEDGNEIDNVMQYNLGLVTKRPAVTDALLPSDLDDERNMSGPATFWISHPDNKINFNHAAGSDGSGIWFAPHQNRNSAAYVPGLDPNKLPLPLGNLDNNVAHSCTHGLLIGPTILPNDTTQTVNPNYDYYPRTAPNRIPPIIKNYTLYKNKLGAYLRVGQNSLTSYWENFIIADNYKGEAITWDGEITEFLWVGGSQNYEPHPPGDGIGGATGLVHLHTIYDGPIRVYDSYFADLINDTMSLFDQWGANVKYTGFTFRNTTVKPGSYRVNFRDQPEQPIWSNAVAYDIDGKLTNTPMTAIHHNIPILSDETTSLIATNTNGAHSYNRYAYVEASPSDGWQCNFETRQKSVFRRSDGVEQRDDFLAVQGVSMVPVVNGKYTYTLTFENEMPYRTRLDYHSMNAGEYVIIGFPDAPLDALVTSTTQSCPYTNFVSNPLPEVSSLENLKNTNGSAYAFEGTTLYTRYEAPAGASFEDNGIVGSILLCLYDDCAVGPNLVFSDADGDGVKDMDETYACRDPYDAKDLEFNFSYNNHGFNTNQIDAVATTQASWIMRADMQNDPYIHKNFNFDGNQIKTIQIKTSCQTSGNYQLRWKTANNNSYNITRMRQASYTQGQLVELTFDMTNDPQWENQTITGIRIDFPVNVNGNIHTQLYWMKGVDAYSDDCYINHYTPNCFDSYIDFGILVDPRGFVASSNNASITISPITATNGCSGANQFTVQRVGTSTNGFADFHINPGTLDWSDYEAISFDICQGNVPYLVYVRDLNAGYTLLGTSNTGGDGLFSLPTDVTRKDEVNDLILRVRNQDLPNNTPVTFSISEIKLKDVPDKTPDYQIDLGAWTAGNSITVLENTDLKLGFVGSFHVDDWEFVYKRPDGTILIPQGLTIGYGAELIHIPPSELLDGGVNDGVWEVLYIDKNTGCSNTASFNVDITPLLDLQLKVWLEGPYNSVGNKMNTFLNLKQGSNIHRGLLPGQTPLNSNTSPTPSGQPYGLEPTNYFGSEGTGWTNADYDLLETQFGADIVDWILVTLRTGLAPTDNVLRKAGLVLEDGRIVFPNPKEILVDPTITELYVLVQHRNHMIILSPTPIPIVNNELVWDFRLQDSYNANMTSFGSKQLPNGQYAMYTGEVDPGIEGQGSGDISGADLIQFQPLNGQYDMYSRADLDLSGDNNLFDKFLWSKNAGIASGVNR